MTSAFVEVGLSVAREQARHMRTGVLNNPNDVSALEVSDAERRRIYEERWATGGINFMARSTT